MSASPGIKLEVCEEKKRLEREIAIHEADYHRAVHVLDVSGKGMDERKHAEILAYLQHLHVTLETANTVLKQHVQDHRCG